jgi:hypothetical protein
MIDESDNGDEDACRAICPSATEPCSPGPEAQLAANAGGDFRFQAPAGGGTRTARQCAATGPAGNLVVRVIILGEG